MFILCSGPDTYRAREKARELMRAFRQKYDAGGFATEIIDRVKNASDVLSHVGTISLFTPKRFVRADGCLSEFSIADVRTLAAKLEADKDQTIVLCVEEEAPAQRILDTLKNAPLVQYAFPQLVGAPFLNWLRDEAKKRGISTDVADRVAEYTEGDSWYAVQELVKQSVHAHAQDTLHTDEGATIFSVADSLLTRAPGWRQTVDEFHDDGLLSVALGQMRSWNMVQAGFADGVHPYVARKMKSVRIVDAPSRFLQMLRSMVASRTSLATSNEAFMLIEE